MGGHKQSNGSQWAAVFCLASQMSIVDRSPQTDHESCCNKLQLISQPKEIVMRLNLGHPRHGPPVLCQPLCLGMKIHEGVVIKIGRQEVLGLQSIDFLVGQIAEDLQEMAKVFARLPGEWTLRISVKFFLARAGA